VPKLLKETEMRIEWTDIDAMVPKQRVDTGKRSSGVHLSGVIKHVLTAAGLLTTDDITDEMPLRMAVGMAWEAFVVQLWPELIWQPGECCKDDIYGSPDGITHTLPCTVLEEFKATWKSRLEKSETKGVTPPPRNILDQKAWVMQMAGYCHMMGLTQARLHVLWVNGDYRQSGPQYYTYLLSFTQGELERMWNNLILTNVDGAKAEQH
jgi:hypothetical protein